MRLNILLVVVSLLLMAEAALVYCRGASEGEEQDFNHHGSPGSSEGGCNVTSRHNLQLGVGSTYTLTTCYDGQSLSGSYNHSTISRITIVCSMLLLLSPLKPQLATTN